MVGGACRTYGGEERFIYSLVGRPERKRLLGRPRLIYGRIILKWMFKKWDGGMYGIHLAQDRDRGRVL